VKRRREDPGFAWERKGLIPATVGSPSNRKKASLTVFETRITRFYSPEEEILTAEQRGKVEGRGTTKTLLGSDISFSLRVDSHGRERTNKYL